MTFRANFKFGIKFLMIKVKQKHYSYAIGINSFNKTNISISPCVINTPKSYAWTMIHYWRSLLQEVLCPWRCVANQILCTRSVARLSK